MRAGGAIFSFSTCAASQFLVALFACSSTPTPPPNPPPATVTFPAGFLWGASTAAFQVEANDAHTDWFHWASTPGKIKNGDTPDPNGPDALAHVDDDVAALTAMHQNAYRFSIEWGRIYPTHDRFRQRHARSDRARCVLEPARETKRRRHHADGHAASLRVSRLALRRDRRRESARVGAHGRHRSVLDVLLAHGEVLRRSRRLVDHDQRAAQPRRRRLRAGELSAGAASRSRRAGSTSRASRRARTRRASTRSKRRDADVEASRGRSTCARSIRTTTPSPTTRPPPNRVRYIFNDWFINAVVRGDWDDDLDGTYTARRTTKPPTPRSSAAPIISASTTTPTRSSRRRAA